MDGFFEMLQQSIPMLEPDLPLKKVEKRDNKKRKATEVQQKQKCQKKTQKTPEEKRQMQAWNWPTNAEEVWKDYKWIPRMQVKSGSKRGVTRCDDPTCCRREGGAFWDVYHTIDWEEYDDPQFAAAREIAKDATSYCRKCMTSEKSRVKVLFGNYHNWKKAVKAGADDNLPKRQRALQLGAKDDTEKEEEEWKTSSRKKPHRTYFTDKSCSTHNSVRRGTARQRHRGSRKTLYRRCSHKTTVRRRRRLATTVCISRRMKSIPTRCRISHPSPHPSPHTTSPSGTN